MATNGQCFIGWFFGSKLHQIINDEGEILDFMITIGNHLNRSPSMKGFLVKSLLIKDSSVRHYLNRLLSMECAITKTRRNMKNCVVHIYHKILLNKIALIETVNDELKNIYQIEHTRDCSFENFITSLLSGLITYSFFPKKPCMNINIIERPALLAHP